MKRLLFFLSFIALAIVIIYSCERDDICAETTTTTPRLIVEFYDTDDRDVLKSVPRISVYGEELFLDVDGNLIQPTEISDSIVIAPDETNYLFNFNSNKMELPLKIGEENLVTTVRYVLEKDTNLRLDEDDPQTSNIDILEIKYKTEFIYVSRACGYKSIFKDLSVKRIVMDDDNIWISSVELEETLELTIENEDTTHVRIYH